MFLFWCKRNITNMKLFNNKAILTLTLISVLSASAAAQESPKAEVMTLHDCMEYAVSNSTKMRIQSADRSDEQWLRRQAIMEAFTPTLSAQTYAYNQYGRNVDPETNTYINTTTFYNGYSVSGGITLFDGFKAVNNIKITGTSQKMGLSKEDQIRDEICLATIEAYCNVLYYSALESVLEQQVETSEVSLAKAKRQEELGQKGHADVVQMASELAKKRYTLVSTTNLKKDALLTLKDVMFYPADEELILDENLPILTAVDENPEAVISQAKAFLPKAAIALGQMNNAKTDLKTARWAYGPNVGLYAGWSTTYYTYPGRADYASTPFKNQFRDNGGEYLQVALYLPIFDRLSKRTKISQKKNTLARATAQYDQSMREIENEVYRAINDKDGAYAALDQARAMADVEEEAFMLNSKRFEQGLISSIEYQTASQSYLNSKAEQLSAQYKYFLKNSVVLYYNGISYLEQY